MWLKVGPESRRKKGNEAAGVGYFKKFVAANA